MQLKWPMLWDLFSLFPAYAGVIPSENAKQVVRFPFPRIRGGDPPSIAVIAPMFIFSPHTRG